MSQLQFYERMYRLMEITYLVQTIILYVCLVVCPWMVVQLARVCAGHSKLHCAKRLIRNFKAIFFLQHLFFHFIWLEKSNNWSEMRYFTNRLKRHLGVAEGKVASVFGGKHVCAVACAVFGGKHVCAQSQIPSIMLQVWRLKRAVQWTLLLHYTAEVTRPPWSPFAQTPKESCA